MINLVHRVGIRDTVEVIYIYIYISLYLSQQYLSSQQFLFDLLFTLQINAFKNTSPHTIHQNKAGYKTVFFFNKINTNRMTCSLCQFSAERRSAESVSTLASIVAIFIVVFISNTCRCSSSNTFWCSSHLVHMASF